MRFPVNDLATVCHAAAQFAAQIDRLQVGQPVEISDSDREDMTFNDAGLANVTFMENARCTCAACMDDDTSMHHPGYVDTPAWAILL